MPRSLLSPDGPTGARSFLQSPASERRPAFSPDGRSIAYESDESGPIEVYIRSFPEPATKRRVSTGGGRFPVWSADGDSIFYRSDEGVHVVAIEAPAAGNQLFEKPFPLRGLDLTPDGQDFVLVHDSEAEHDAMQLNLVLNWSRELEQRVPP